ncbi:hypothetical protein FC756_00010 [Lysinibacillus mangiferihumi]|uniref:DUF2798 domain-containing protein n=1 Tax=Lysinibacillus mangiferihumi TaxID=1130819 RepID=A0A4U2ZDZ1_9BACI|nr:hypothetical protein [Lysinibacillus mangiferihumi]TKI72717.1 hypothetical protein FC756_00010 [Lysinibacillus mangiferihumi]
MKAKGVLKGIIIAIFCSIFIPYLFNSVGNTFAGGRISYWGESWLYIAFSIPMIVSMAIIGYYLSTQKNIPNKKMWWISFLVALIVSLFTGTLGILISEMILRGNLNTFNLEGSMIWGVIYSLIFLPITVPLGKLILNSLHYWIHKPAS